MKIRHLDMAPSVHPEAYVAPTAVLSGEVRVGRGSCLMPAPGLPPAPGTRVPPRRGGAAPGGAPGGEGGGGSPRFVSGVGEAGDRHEQMRAALQCYTGAMARHHREDEVIRASDGGG